MVVVLGVPPRALLGARAGASFDGSSCIAGRDVSGVCFVASAVHSVWAASGFPKPGIENAVAEAEDSLTS